jgi:hypothetical protein
MESPKLFKNLLLLVSLVLPILLSLTNSSSNTTNASSYYGEKKAWQRVNDGDCPGHDIDSTIGFIPDNAKVKAGYTAVCWDGKKYNNNNQPGKIFCTYKNIGPEACTGGSNTGAMYRGIVSTVVWKKVRVGDCAGHDIDNSNGFIPDDAKAKEGYTAVCWDGKTYNNSNENGRVFCTYKNIAPENCSGGTNLGVIYQAVVSTVVWEKVRVGDCAGHDVDNSIGFIPDDAKAKEGLIAVCWDGQTYNNSNENGRVFCTYKNIAAENCSGGTNLGVIYRAVAK